MTKILENTQQQELKDPAKEIVIMVVDIKNNKEDRVKSSLFKIINIIMISDNIQNNEHYKYIHSGGYTLNIYIIKIPEKFGNILLSA